MDAASHLARVFSPSARPIAVLTAYDAMTARLAVLGGADALLVGDSLGTTVQGKKGTRGVSLEHMEYHTGLVADNAENAPVIADLPADTYRNIAEGIASARRLMKAGAHAVKYEGNIPGLAEAFHHEGIPLMGHLGLLPQTAETFKVRGKDPKEGESILLDALALQNAGAFSLVLECVPRALGSKVQEALSIPVIGIGAGASTAGQVLVIYDLLQFLPGERRPRFVPVRYPSGGELLLDIVRRWTADVRDRTYPMDSETYG